MFLSDFLGEKPEEELFFEKLISWLMPILFLAPTSTKKRIKDSEQPKRVTLRIHEFYKKNI